MNSRNNGSYGQKIIIGRNKLYLLGERKLLHKRDRRVAKDSAFQGSFIEQNHEVRWVL